MMNHHPTHCIKWICLFLACFAGPFVTHAQIETYSSRNKTPGYDEVIKFYAAAAKKNAAFKWITGGKTDVGKPLHLFVISKNRNFDAKKLHAEGKAIVLINNGIHPGEPDGIDACIQLVKEFSEQPGSIPDSVVICIVPVYNVDGALQRNSVMRMNQNGPAEFGFRGNGQNLDLNRDFMKCDAGNTRAISTFFHNWNPDVLIDTHVSNGADYPYTMTLISTQRSKLAAPLSKFLYGNLLPDIYADMKQKGNEICPYVESHKETPDSGIVEFMETPRFMTGWASLFNCIGFVTESHMLKPYPDRVIATKQILQTILKLTKQRRKEILKARKEADALLAEKKYFAFNWKLNENKKETFLFSGYAAKYKPSKISGKDRLYYERSEVWKREIPYYCHYTASDSAKKPDLYLIPQAWKKVIECLNINGVQMKELKQDTLISCEVYYIEDFKTGPRPYEGHYLHTEVKTRAETQTLKFYKGDVVVDMRGNTQGRYIAEALEPRSEDSFFAWGFFDAILNQKEWFSDYVFEEVAEDILKENPELKAEFEKARDGSKSLSSDHWAQLNFIFQHSKYKEKSHNRYPVVRVMMK